MASAVLFRYSTVSDGDIDTNGLFIVCEEDSNIDATANVSERKTKCGTFTGVDSPTFKIAGSGVAVGDLAATSASGQDIMKLVQSGANIFFLYQNATAGTIAAGEITYARGQGYFSKATITSNTGDGVVTFDWEFTPSGTVSLTPP